VENTWTADKAKIRAFTDGWSNRSHPFVWTNTADDIIEQPDRANYFRGSALALDLPASGQALRWRRLADQHPSRR
jgi:hypothetical protein